MKDSFYKAMQDARENDPLRKWMARLLIPFAIIMTVAYTNLDTEQTTPPKPSENSQIKLPTHPAP